MTLLGPLRYYSANFLLDWLLTKLWSNLQVTLSATLLLWTCCSLQRKCTNVQSEYSKFSIKLIPCLAVAFQSGKGRELIILRDFYFSSFIHDTAQRSIVHSSIFHFLSCSLTFTVQNMPHFMTTNRKIAQNSEFSCLALNITFQLCLYLPTRLQSPCGLHVLFTTWIAYHCSLSKVVSIYSVVGGWVDGWIFLLCQ